MSGPRQQLRQRRGLLLCIGTALFFGTAIVDQKLHAQINHLLVLSQLSSFLEPEQPLPHRDENNDSVSVQIITPPPLSSTNDSSSATTTTIQDRFHTIINDSMDYFWTTTTGMAHTENINNTDITTDSRHSDLSNENSSSWLTISTSSQSSLLHSSTSQDVNETNQFTLNIDDDHFYHSNRLPQWFHEYTQWHTQTMQHMAIHQNYNDYQYVILRCVRNDKKCYGTSDRLKMIPVMLKLAYMSQRLLFIYWSRPFPIEEFLLPNTYYMNWTVPDYLYETLDVEAVRPIWKLGQHQEHGMLDGRSQSQRVIRIMAMTYASGYYDTHPIQRRNATSNDDATMYLPYQNNDTMNLPYQNNDTEDELPMWDVYSDFWRAMFQPSLGVFDEIVSTLRDLDLLLSTNEESDSTLLHDSSALLIPQIKVKPYVSVHVRANYIGDDTDNHPEENAIRCANILQQQYNDYKYSTDNNTNSSSSSNISSTNPLPIYIASDTSIVTQNAIKYGWDQSLLVLSRDSQQHSIYDPTTNTSTMMNITNPYHIDQPPSDVVLFPRDFYDTFVDMYLLAMGRCHTWGVGGYGSWAAAIAPPKFQVSADHPSVRVQEICPSIVHFKQHC